MKIKTSAALVVFLATLARATSSDVAQAEQETRYLVFQVFPAMPHSVFPPVVPSAPGRMALSKEQMADFVRSVVKPIGTTGDARHKLGFAIGPICFDMPDEEVREWIHDAFAVARENDVAVALHIDDSMFWGQRKDLLSTPDNIETADWRQIPNTGRRLDWGPKPAKVAPQMCFNAPAIIAAVEARGKLIGAEVARELVVLKSQGKEHLFAAVIAGWETQIGRDLETGRPLGFRALAHRGFSEKNPPKDLDAERVSVVKEWIELWAKSLHTGGAPREKIFCHIAFTDQGLRKPTATESYAERVHFAPSEVAFSSTYRPGFSTYPEGDTFKQIHEAVGAHGSPGWISAEGVNVSPTTMPGEARMETYLAKTFNHGGVLVNIFSWGMGGEAHRDNFYRRATENPDALADYAKFLRGEQLVESAGGFSSTTFIDKMRRVQAELPGWIQKTGRQAEAVPLMRKVQSLMKDKKWLEADKAADELLALMKSAPTETKQGASTVTERLPAKIQRIQKELPAWIGSDADKKSKATALMQQLQALLKAMQFDEAEKIADAILEMIDQGSSSLAAPSGVVGISL